MIEAFLCRVTRSCAVIPNSSAMMATSVAILKLDTAFHQVNYRLLALVDRFGRGSYPVQASVESSIPCARNLTLEHCNKDGTQQP